MPRKPTGQPRGRPPGSGKLTPSQRFEDGQSRVSLRLPTTLYDRLEAFAAGRHFHRGSPQLAGCVREALEDYLDRHTKRPTGHVLPATMDTICQTGNGIQPPGDVSHVTEDITCQTGNILYPLAEGEETIESQTGNIPEASLQSPEALSCQTENVPPFDTTKYALGNLCTHGHAYQSTGQSLRRLADRECLACQRTRAQAARHRKRQAVSVA